MTALGVGHAVAGLARGIEKVVGDQAVVLGIEAGDDGEVIGKGERGIAGQHAFRSPDALLAKRQQMRGVVALGVVPAEAVERNQDDVVLLLRLGGVGAVIDVDERERGIEGWFPALRRTEDAAQGAGGQMPEAARPQSFRSH